LDSYIVHMISCKKLDDYLYSALPIYKDKIYYTIRRNDNY